MLPEARGGMAGYLSRGAAAGAINPIAADGGDMSATNRRIKLHARRLLDLHGDRATTMAEEMVAHLVAIGDDERAAEWRQIAATIREMRQGEGRG